MGASLLLINPALLMAPVLPVVYFWCSSQFSHPQVSPNSVKRYAVLCYTGKASEGFDNASKILPPTSSFVSPVFLSSFFWLAFHHGALP